MQVFSDCSCTDSSTHESTECVSNCSIYGAYWIILFLAVISHSMAQVGVVMLFIRSVIGQIIRGVARIFFGGRV